MSEVAVATSGERTVVITINPDNSVRVEFPFWRDPVAQMPLAVTYAPNTTLSFIEVQVRAVLNGEVPPFIGL